MSDVVHEHQETHPVHTVDPALPEREAPALTGASSADRMDALLRRRSASLPASAVLPGSTGRVQRSSSRFSARPLAEPTSGQQRVQRSTAVGVGEPAPTIARVQPMAAGVIRRDFVGAMQSAGRGIKSAAKATGNAVKETGKFVGKKAKQLAVGVGNFVHRSDFNDLNATQYLVTGYKIEAINRGTDDNGQVVYFRTGLIIGFDGERPKVQDYDPVQPMPPDWLPTVTHINGMMVKPKSGIGSALRLQQELAKAAGPTLLADDVPSVLYTYSAHRGFVTDLAECVWGKLYQDDDATDRQTQIMLDAVENQHRTTVSAHSRGTIKTDNAVRNAHATISGNMMAAALADPAVAALARQAAIMAADPGMGLSAAMLEPVYLRLFAREHADKLATAELDRYVQLIYAGNAVQFPSASVNLHLVVAGSDPVTIAVGKYFRAAKGKKTNMTDIEGGHGFSGNYAETVAGLIIADLVANRQ